MGIGYPLQRWAKAPIKDNCRALIQPALDQNWVILAHVCLDTCDFLKSINVWFPEAEEKVQIIKPLQIVLGLPPLFFPSSIFPLTLFSLQITIIMLTFIGKIITSLYLLPNQHIFLAVAM